MGQNVFVCHRDASENMPTTSADRAYDGVYDQPHVQQTSAANVRLTFPDDEVKINSSVRPAIAPLVTTISLRDFVYPEDLKRMFFTKQFAVEARSLEGQAGTTSSSHVACIELTELAENDVDALDSEYLVSIQVQPKLQEAQPSFLDFCPRRQSPIAEKTTSPQHASSIEKIVSKFASILYFPEEYIDADTASKTMVLFREAIVNVVAASRNMVIAFAVPGDINEKIVGQMARAFAEYYDSNEPAELKFNNRVKVILMQKRTVESPLRPYESQVQSFFSSVDRFACPVCVAHLATCYSSTCGHQIGCHGCASKVLLKETGVERAKCHFCREALTLRHKLTELDRSIYAYLNCSDCALVATGFVAYPCGHLVGDCEAHAAEVGKPCSVCKKIITQCHRLFFS